MILLAILDAFFSHDGLELSFRAESGESNAISCVYSMRDTRLPMIFYVMRNVQKYIIDHHVQCNITYCNACLVHPEASITSLRGHETMAHNLIWVSLTPCTLVVRVQCNITYGERSCHSSRL